MRGQVTVGLANSLEHVQGVRASVCWERGWGGCRARSVLRPFAGASKREKQYQVHQGFGDRRDGVVSARTYFYANEAKCDSHMETFLRCIEASGGAALLAGCPPARPSPATRGNACAGGRTGGRAQGFLSVWAALTVVRIIWGDRGEPQARLKSHWGQACVQQLREEPSCPQEDASLPFPGHWVPVWTSGKAFGGQWLPGVAAARRWVRKALGFARAALFREHVSISSGGEFLLTASRREPLPKGSLRPRVL